MKILMTLIIHEKCGEEVHIASMACKDLESEIRLVNCG